MNSILTINKNNKKGSFYLSNCDLINKYNIKTTYGIPKIEKIILEFPFEEFVKSCNFIEKDPTNPIFQMKGAIIFYILTNLMPYINFNKSIVVLKKNVSLENNYSLKIIITNKEEINLFLNTLFVENWSKLLVEDFSLFKKADLKYNNQKSIVLRTSISGNSFIEIENFLNQYFSKINSRNLLIKCNFVLSNLNKKITSINLIKNLTPFWINI